ncbi:MAG: hypothetical protein HXY35_02215 [Chloroflexi bacterium]|nr:hypothetical protein [Chloroflexota bacterium]
MKNVIKYSIVVLLVLLPACAAIPSASSPATPTDTQPPGIPTDIWNALFQRTPVPWTTPLPPLKATDIDATYVKINPRQATPFPCKRCPDYALEGGLWKFSLNKGIFRIYYTMNGWRSLGSYTISGDHIYLFNDPYCNWDTGEYIWKLEGGVLVFTEVNDPCSQGLRAANLTDQPWLSCTPPNVEAMITDHWQKPEGCDPQETTN